MSTKLYIGGLPYSVDNTRLEELFAKYGAVVSAQVISDKFTGRSRGFGFVEFENKQDAENAIAEMNGKEIDGRSITVNEARPMAKKDGPRPRSSAGNGRRSRNWD